MSHTESHPRKLTWLLLAVAAVVLFLWSLVVPIFEAPDEPHHWQYANYMHTYWRLPPYNRDFVEGNQAPLYYLLVSPFSVHSSLPPFEAAIEDGKMVQSCPPRFYENCPADFRKYWPIRIVRLLTAFISVATVLFTVRAASEMSGSQNIGLLAGALVAFLPQFTFRGSTVNNDAMVACSCAAATWWLVRFARSEESRAAMWCAIACTLAFLSKINGIVVSIGFIACIATSRMPWSERLRWTKFIFLGILVVSPWLIRNRLLYGDLTTQRVMPKVVPVLVDRKSLMASYFYTTFPRELWHSSIGVFGWHNISMPSYVYYIYLLIGIAALMGLVIGVKQHKIDRKMTFLLSIIVIMTVAATVQLNLTFTQPQGRYLFPALSATMILVATGLSALPRWSTVTTGGLIGIVVMINLYALGEVVYPGYWRQTPVALQVDSDSSATLTGISPSITLEPGHSFTQSFAAKHNNLTAIDIQVSNNGSPSSVGTIVLHLRSTVMVTDIASVRMPASIVRHCCVYATLAFAPIKDSEGKHYYLSVETLGLSSASRIAVLVGTDKLGASSEFFVDQVSTHKTALFRTYYTPRLEPCPKCLHTMGGAK